MHSDTDSNDSKFSEPPEKKAKFSKLNKTVPKKVISRRISARNIAKKENNTVITTCSNNLPTPPKREKKIEIAGTSKEVTTPPKKKKKVEITCTSKEDAIQSLFPKQNILYLNNTSSEISNVNECVIDDLKGEQKIRENNYKSNLFQYNASYYFSLVSAVENLSEDINEIHKDVFEIKSQLKWANKLLEKINTGGANNMNNFSNMLLQEFKLPISTTEELENFLQRLQDDK